MITFPSNHEVVGDVRYLTRNMLTGPIPTWILKTNKNMYVYFYDAEY